MTVHTARRANGATLLAGEPVPDPLFLLCLECVSETFGRDGAAQADGFGPSDAEDIAALGEEQVGVHTATRGARPP